MQLCEVVHTVFSYFELWQTGLRINTEEDCVTWIYCSEGLTGRSRGKVWGLHTPPPPTLPSKFLSYLWVRFTTCLTPGFLKRQERIVSLKWLGKRKGWGRALRWIYPLTSYCLFGIRVNLFHCWTASLRFISILTLKRLSTLTNNYLTVPFRLSTTVNDVK